MTGTLNEHELMVLTSRVEKLGATYCTLHSLSVRSSHIRITHRRLGLLLPTLLFEHPFLFVLLYVRMGRHVLLLVRTPQSMTGANSHVTKLAATADVGVDCEGCCST